MVASHPPSVPASPGVETAIPGDNPPPDLSFTRLALTGFRSYPRLRLEIAQRPFVILAGPNGAGKTNILEALSYLAPGRGLRGAVLRDVAYRQPPQTPERRGQSWAVAADLCHQGHTTRLGSGWSSGGAARREVRIEGKSAKSSASLSAIFPMLWLTPAMDRLFQEGASGRRRLLDRMTTTLFPDHSVQLSAYERAMRERTRLLEGQASGQRVDANWLTALERRMAEHGTAIAAARLECAAQLLGQMSGASDGGKGASPAAFPTPTLMLEGYLEARLARGDTVLTVEDSYADALARARPEDGARRRTALGPHRSDLIVTMAESGMPASECSTGEQKALLISLILAHGRLVKSLRGTAPIMLIDEAGAHLDARRRTAFFHSLATLGSQCWLTGTDLGLFTEISGVSTTFLLEESSIRSASVP